MRSGAENGFVSMLAATPEVSFNRANVIKLLHPNTAAVSVKLTYESAKPLCRSSASTVGSRPRNSWKMSMG